MNTPAGDRPGRFGLIGSGWRTEFFLRLARRVPEWFAPCGVVTRTAERGEVVEREWGLPTYRSAEDLVAATRPEFVVVSVPWPQTPGLVRELAESGVRVLAETPPAPDGPGLASLWDAVGGTGLVQVAEQYPRMPGHAARSAAVAAGLIGEPTSVQISSTHLYHAVAVMRAVLGVGMTPATVSAQNFSAPLVDPLTPDGWTDAIEPKPATTTLATLDWGGGRMGLYDFTDNQWWNPLRQRRIVIRGSAGEIVDDRLVRMLDPRTPVESRFLRSQNGFDLDLLGLEIRNWSLDGQVLWRNRFGGARFSEDDVAVADLLADTVAWARDLGPEPYPLADGCQDHLLSLAMGESISTGERVRVTPGPWASQGPQP